MKLNRNYVRILLIIVSLVSLIPCRVKAQHGIVQDDPVVAPTLLLFQPSMEEEMTLAGRTFLAEYCTGMDSV